MERILTIQDVSCVGKCSLTVALPIISAFGVETAILPTAVLSTHTAFKGFTFRDLTSDIEPIYNHWLKEGFSFKSIYYDCPIQPNRALDIFVPKEITQKKSFFFIHGGGWRNGTRAVYHKIMEQLCNLGFVCASADYNLRAKNAFIQIADLRVGYDIYLQELANLGIRQPEVIVFGSSAGAHLGLLFTLTTPDQLNEGQEELAKNFIPPAMGIFQSTPTYFAPWDDIFPGIATSMTDIAGVSYQDNPQVYEQLSPITYVNENSCPIFLSIE